LINEIAYFFKDPDLNKAHRSSAIGDFLAAFLNVYPSRILSTPMGIDYLSKLHGD
jgi:hypothetical protein